jgi:hypothetical protein
VILKLAKSSLCRSNFGNGWDSLNSILWILFFEFSVKQSLKTFLQLFPWLGQLFPWLGIFGERISKKIFGVGSTTDALSAAQASDSWLVAETFSIIYGQQLVCVDSNTRVIFSFAHHRWHPEMRDFTVKVLASSFKGINPS